jgi:preprotein translocase subunit SecY
MGNFFTKLSLIFTDGSLMRRLGFIVLVLVVYRLMAAIPIPGIDEARLAEFFQNSSLLGFLSVFSGGGLSNLSIVMLGVAPYITASIIMQLATIIVPQLKSMYQEEGEMGRKRFGQYSRLLAVPLAIAQGVGLLYYFETQGLITSLTWYTFAVNVLIVVTGSMFLMWLGELISEFGIGNGVSLIIFAGIVSGMPAIVSQLIFTFDASQIPLYAGFLAAALIITFGVVYVSEAERPVPVTYAKRMVGGRETGGVQSYVPLRLNQAGVMPIIFALSIITIPQFVISAITRFVTDPTILSLVTQLTTFPGNQVVYGVFYFLLVFLFTYFFTAVTFDPTQMANNLQKNGAFVAGIRPGLQTAEYLGRVITRITLVGAVFLGIIAVLPLAMQYITGTATFAVGGTALLIVVSVVLDLVRKIDAQVSLREY